MKTAFALLLGASITLAACGEQSVRDPVYLGVLLPMSDESNTGWGPTLDWVKESVNDAGGIDGRPLDYVYYDTAGGTTATQLNRLLAENRVTAVIGPDSSGPAFDAAPKLIAARIPFFTIASSADLFKAYKGSGYVWRTVESDVAQVQTLLLLAKRQGVHRVSLLVNDTVYGSTFFDWFGFFATELGIDVTAIVQTRMDAGDCATYSEAAVAGAPEVVFVVPAEVTQGTCIARYLRTSHPDVRLVYSDIGVAPAYLSDLGDLAEGLEGVTYGYDPGSGFGVAYRVLFGEEPPAYSANLYDSVMILALALEAAGGEGGEALSDAIRRVVDGRGEKTGWDTYEIGRALDMLSRGESPDITGTTGGLEFDEEDYTDPLATTYAHWRIEAGEYVTTEYFTTGGDTPLGRKQITDAAFQTYASDAMLQRLSDSTAPTVKPRTGNWALVVSTSDGWANYRHQADALAQYELLRRNGFPDDHIVFVTADDLAANPLNPEPGTVRNEPGGENLYESPEIDYHPGDLDPRALMDILSGQATPERPTVIASTDTDDVYVFLVGHGGSNGICLKDCAEVLTPADLQSTVAAMAAAGRFRRMLIVVEACHGGVMGAGLTTPGVLLLAGANPFESSLAANYDQELDAWLSDEFAFAYYSTLLGQPDLALYDLYRTTYLAVPGSHVTLYNAESFGDLSAIGAAEFVRPGS